MKYDPDPYVIAEPIPGNILKWHYVITGPENTPYARGLYHGKLVFPINYPFEPPTIYMITPNGRLVLVLFLLAGFYQTSHASQL
ncbi:Ubiquitin-conjugating enzyme E2 J2 [Zootermopsis nevadensis]|uniref:Ubiquitin-conjugating enzyme E2 J2 n=1 Tax=Zootermopsis nevadensis TaxID=136037 RepID=A0A067R203_ZOONE|nr:Ubiquitin-conjugating enzyme E2 J2 [Zootermopsis nevadensis]